MNNNGHIEVIVGGMFSGKSEELIRRARRTILAKQHTIIFNHASDIRYGKNEVVSHNKNRLIAYAVSSASDILTTLDNEESHLNFEVVCIDEAQFFGEEIVSVCETLANRGVRVIVAGLDQDFRGEPFAPMHILMAKAEFVEKLNAICVCCGSIASRTQRLVDGRPAKYSDKIVQVGAKESYEARCRHCHKVEK